MGQQSNMGCTGSTSKTTTIPSIPQPIPSVCRGEEEAKPEGTPSPDTHVTIVPYFTIPEGKMDEFKAGFPTFYEHTKAGTKTSGECEYYGFAIEGNTVFCREGYKSADGVLAHLGEVKEELDAAVAMVGEGGLNLAVMGPAAELEKLKEALGPLGTKFYALDEGSMTFGG